MTYGDTMDIKLKTLKDIRIAVYSPLEWKEGADPVLRWNTTEPTRITITTPLEEIVRTQDEEDIILCEIRYAIKAPWVYGGDTVRSHGVISNSPIGQVILHAVPNLFKERNCKSWAPDSPDEEWNCQCDLCYYRDPEEPEDYDGVPADTGSV
jgi:hypothetical protein